MRPWDDDRLRFANSAGEVGLWWWNSAGDEMSLDDRSHILWGTRGDREVTLQERLTHVHPDDRDQFASAFEAARTTSGHHEVDFRIILSSSEIRWLLARCHSNSVTHPDRITFGIFLDITDRKRAEEARELRAGEMAHRIKNLFAIASALTSIAARSAATTADMAHDLSKRLHALSCAQELIFPTTDDMTRAGVPLNDLFGALLLPYTDGWTFRNRINVAVSGAIVGERSTTTMALIVHELATNSVKHGALGSADGRLDVTCTNEPGADELTLIWTEVVGTNVITPRGLSGYGTKLVSRSLSGQLGGSISYDWRPNGVIITLQINKTLLAR